MNLPYIILFLISSTPIFPQESQVLEFNNRPIRDVLAVMGELNKRRIIPDETVSGNCSFYFSTSDMSEALELFLKSQNLFISEWEGVHRVSKISSHISNSVIDLQCREVDIELIIKNLIELTGVTILYDNLPKELLTLNIRQLDIEKTLEIILKQFRDYQLETSENFYYITKNHDVENIEEDNSNQISISESGLYSINIKRTRFSQIIREFFTKSHVEYFIQGRNDNIIESLSFSEKSFSAMLELIMEAGSCDYSYSNGIYYIFDINKNEIQNRHLETRIIQLKNLQVKDLVKVMPGIYMSNNVLKIDESSNSVIIYGTEIKTAPIYRFIEMVDKNPGKSPRLIKPDFIEVDLLKSILLKQFPVESIINIDNESFIILLTDEEYDRVQRIIVDVDIAPESHLVTLKYITNETLMENLPKSISEDSLISTPNPSQVSYYGTESGLHHLERELEKIDRPVPQIKYKVLVIQSMLGDDFSFDLNSSIYSDNISDIEFENSRLYSYAGSLGELIGLNFNVLSAFGPLFSFELNTSLKENKSKILVDTTLQALSGKTVNFRNTTTSRFYQKTVDADGNEETTGATQEVSWGIILDIEGWTSGDGMVTVNVDATLSDETTVSGDSSGIPSTSEKIVNTEVRTRDGEPVVISGLISSKKETSYIRTPILGHIPILGRLFSKQIETETQSEFTIYLLPYIEEDREDLNSRMETVYKELFP